MKKSTLLAIILILTFLGLGVAYLLLNADIALLQPAGDIGQQQTDLLIFSLVLSLVIIVPVFSLTLFIAIRYREGNKKAAYRPNWSHSKVLETIWWGIPIILIAFLGVIIWQSSHALDPKKALESDQPPLKVQVVALQWRWLFIYPDQGIATVNTLEIPTNRTIEFKIAADGPMSSFWIPKLGGQIYAMPGMITTLHLNATKAGDYTGKNTNISGEGYSDMVFSVKARSPQEFENWTKNSVDSDKNVLSLDVYNQLSNPKRDKSQMLFNDVENELFNEIVNKYMMPEESNNKGMKMSATNKPIHSGAY